MVKTKSRDMDAISEVCQTPRSRSKGLGLLTSLRFIIPERDRRVFSLLFSILVFCEIPQIIAETLAP